MGWAHAPFRFFLGGLGSALKARSQAAVHAKVHLLRFAIWTQTVEERIEEYSVHPVSPATGANTARTLRNKNIIKKRAVLRTAPLCLLDGMGHSCERLHDLRVMRCN